MKPLEPRRRRRAPLPAGELVRGGVMEQEIADGLSEAQRRAVLDFDRVAEAAGIPSISYFTAARCRAALQDKGVVEAPMYSTRLTPLGLSVRAILKEKEG